MNFRQNLDTINRLLNHPDITGMGGYSLGVISSLAQKDYIIAPDELLEAAAQCQTIAEADRLYRMFRRTFFCTEVTEATEVFGAYKALRRDLLATRAK
jgi:hypothetical protein